jgi:hypothetical protein
LTGDGELRALASAKNVPFFGVLWVLDRLFESAVIEAPILASGLDAIATHPRCRLPVEKIQVRLTRYRRDANLTSVSPLAYHLHRLSRPSSPLARYLFGIVIGFERAGGQPCRRPPFGTLDQLPDKGGYCITAVARETTYFRPGARVEIEPDAHFLANA